MYGQDWVIMTCLLKSFDEFKYKVMSLVSIDDKIVIGSKDLLTKNDIKEFYAEFKIFV